MAKADLKTKATAAGQALLAKEHCDVECTRWSGCQRNFQFELMAT